LTKKSHFEIPHTGNAPTSLEDRSATGRMTKPFLLGIIVLGCAIRLLHFWSISQTAFLKITFVFTNSDPYAFWHWAQKILAGDLLGRDTYHPYFDWMQKMAPLEIWSRWWGGKEIFQQAPLYPYLVAGLLALSNNSLSFVVLAQLLLGGLHPWVMFSLARRLFDDRVGLVVAGLTAFYGPFIFHEGALLRDWLPPIVEPIALVALLRARATYRARDALLAGALIGVAALVRESALLLVAMAIFWILLENRSAWRRAGRLAAVVSLGFSVALLPLVMRNYLVEASLFALSNRAAESLILGNAADTFPVGLHHPLSMKGILERSDGRLGPVIRETLGTYQGDWLRFVRVQLFKLRGLADPFEVPDNLNFAFGIEISPILRFMLRYGLIFPLGVTGFLLSIKALRRHLLLPLYGLVTIGGLLITIIHARYRLVLVPVLMVYGAAGLVLLFEAIRRRQTVKGLAYLSLLLAIAVAQHLLLPLWWMREDPFSALHPPEYFLSAKVYAAEGRPDRAVAEMERLKAKATQHPSFGEQVTEATLAEGFYRVVWAEQLVNWGRLTEATRQVELAQTAYASHPNLSFPYFAIGGLYLRLGEPAKAKALLARFLELEPHGPNAEAVRNALSRLKPRN
jgi:hypothetical protein